MTQPNDAVTVYHGDALDVLRTLPDASVDAVVTDPPYDLTAVSRKGSARVPGTGPFGRHTLDTKPRGGFMGNQWDSTGIAFRVDLWADVLRVLRPGGHVLAFGGTRTVHRLTCAIEDAGFEIRDSIDWLYGCLSADTEILTEHGWRPGLDVAVGDQVAQWDPASGTVELAEVQETYRGPWFGSMRVLRNADTDQLLTPNHRVYHKPCRRRMANDERAARCDDRWHVADARKLSTWARIHLPVGGVHDGPGVGGEDYAALLGWVWAEGGFDLSGAGVRIYQSSVNADKVDQIQNLMDRIGPHRRYDYPRTSTRRRGQTPRCTVTWFVTGGLAARIRADLPGKRPTYGLLWRMTAAEKRALLRATQLAVGSQLSTGGWQFYQQNEDDLVWLQTLLALTGQAGKVGMRPDRSGGAVYLRQRDTTELQARHLRTAWQQYTGEVWCVRVPTGAFLARRNGRVFITGNSGFPKSLDVSKAIDKANGDPLDFHRFAHALAEAVDRSALTFADIDRHLGIKASSCRWVRTDKRGGLPPRHHWEQLRDLLDLDNGLGLLYEQALRAVRRVTDPAVGAAFSPTKTVRDAGTPVTEQARRWAGWGTALKPAREPIVVARKPLTGTVAQNVLAHGTGALNIDACRVPHASPADRVESERKNQHGDFGSGPMRNEVYGKFSRDRENYDGSAGRWPPNVVLSHVGYAAYALRHDVPDAVKEAIHAYYGHLEAVRQVWGRDPRNAVGAGEAPVLFAGVREPGAASGSGEAVGHSDLRDVSAGIRGDAGLGEGRPSSVLLSGVPGEGAAGEPRQDGSAPHGGVSVEDGGGGEERPGQRDVAGRPVREQGICPCARGCAAARCAGPGAEDDAREVHLGAPGDSGGTDRSAADDRRHRSPRERDQDGQPSGEPNRDAAGGSLGGASGDRAEVPRPAVRARSAAHRERRLTVPAGEVPTGWLTYFEPAAEVDLCGDGCVDGCPVAELDRQSGTLSGGRLDRSRIPASAVERRLHHRRKGGYEAGSGEASRFFPVFRYQAKASSRERPRVGGVAHSTVKPLNLLRWLVRLVTPPGGLVLDPFAGSGTTAEACQLEGFRCIAVEREASYVPLIRARLSRAQPAAGQATEKDKL